jgi:hypothetical protein
MPHTPQILSKLQAQLSWAFTDTTTEQTHALDSILGHSVLLDDCGCRFARRSRSDSIFSTDGGGVHQVGFCTSFLNQSLQIVSMLHVEEKRNGAGKD